jgi:uracil-DNA glycosylase family 4
MVSNNEIVIDKEIRILADSLITQLEWARRNFVKTLPNAKAREEDMPKKAPPENETPSMIEKLLASSGDKLQKLTTLKDEIMGDCRRCKLCDERNNIVFGVGSIDARLLFVGEGPGAEEDKQGLPFVGRSGQLLTKMIEAMGISRNHVYICNVVKCRPPNNRDPEPEEVSSCIPFLKAQLAIIKPKVIVTLGRYASQTLLESTTPMSQLRGQWTSFEGVDLMPTFHPAFLLRNPPKKKEVWQDLQMVMQRLGGDASPSQE